MGPEPMGATFAFSQWIGTSGLAGSRLHEGLLDIRREELASPAGRAALGFAFAVGDRAARLAAEVLLTALRTNDRRRFGKKLTDLPQLVRDAQGIDTRPGLIGLDKAVHERVEAHERFFHVCR